MTHDVTATLIGGPTVLLRYAGLTILTDPTFDAPGTIDGLAKLAGPAIASADLPAIDLALASHDHHADNLDVEGLRVAKGATMALTTTKGALRKEGLAALDPGETAVMQGDVEVHVTAVRAQHGPWPLSISLGPVIGFVLQAEGWPTVYFSGDNSSVAVARGVAKEFRDVSIAMLCMGAARVPARFPWPFTLDARRAAAVARLWPSATIVPVHWDSWGHFTEPREAALPGLERRGLLPRTVVLEAGVETTLPVG